MNKGTGVVFFNMGGPQKVADVGPFLYNLFTDTDIIQMPFQRWLAPLLAKRRTPHVSQLYSEIGGGSPIHHWTQVQAEESMKILDQIRPESAPHRPYIAFRYVNPRVRDTLLQMKEDGIERAVAFTQYPQFSCTTTGSSFNELWKEVKSLQLETQFRWSLIDRWPVHPLFIQSVVKKIHQGLDLFPSKEDRDSVHIIFSAHSLPLKTVFKGDQYPAEVGATVFQVMSSLNFSHRYLLSWQSQVGRIPWLGPQTDKV